MGIIEDAFFQKALAQGSQGISIKELAAEVGLAPSTVHKELQALVAQKRATREGRGPYTRYVARPYLRVVWVDPQRGLHEAWDTNEPVDWHYPLVTRIPDAAAQEVLRRFLPRLEAIVGSAALTVVAYGSCATGEARASSDLDLLIFRDKDLIDHDVQDLVDEANLWGLRPLDVRLAQELDSTPRGVREAVRAHGKTIFSTASGTGAFPEAQRSDA